MTFEIFDRSTERNYASKDMRMVINRIAKRIRFNVFATSELQLQPETGVRFLRFEKQWFVCRTTDAAGYSIKSESNGRSRCGTSCNAVITANNILKDFGKLADKVDFFLLPTEHEYHGSKLFEIVPMPELKAS